MSEIELKACPFCKKNGLMLDQMEVDIEVGVMKGPEQWHCENCQSYWTGPYLFNRPPSSASPLEWRVERLLKLYRQLAKVCLCRDSNGKYDGDAFNACLEAIENIEAQLPSPPKQEDKL